LEMEPTRIYLHPFLLFRIVLKTKRMKMKGKKMKIVMKRDFDDGHQRHTDGGVRKEKVKIKE